jgi:translation initiation factor IF-2
MRARGAKVTDIVVLVIAAEDGVMAQTEESISHAKESGCPIIVAINKIDKASPAQIDRVKRDLLKYELIPEDMGGDVQVVPISALKGTNLDRLKEEIWAQSEVMELTGDPRGLVEGYIIESTQDEHKGKLATVLIQRGTLKRGDYVVAGNSWCKVKLLSDENSQNLQTASLSQAVQIMGWKELPSPGDEVLQVQTEHIAKHIVDVRHKKLVALRQKSDAEEIKKVGIVFIHFVSKIRASLPINQTKILFYSRNEKSMYMSTKKCLRRSTRLAANDLLQPSRSIKL